MTAPIWASIALAAFGALAILLQTQPLHRALAILAFIVAACFGVVRLVPLALPAALLGLWLWRGMPGRSHHPKKRTRASPAPDAVVESAGLRMTLDRVTGAMDGEVLAGPHAGRRLSELSSETIRGLAAGFEASKDEESLALLLAWLDRAGRRDEATGAVPTNGPMTEAEAYDVLGLTPGASVEEVRSAYRRLMRRVHPDLGGSGALAAMLNAAKDMLDPN
jgi:hypothetical protein